MFRKMGQKVRSAVVGQRKNNPVDIYQAGEYDKKFFSEKSAEISALLSQKKFAEVKKLLADIHYADIAIILSMVEDEYKIPLFTQINTDDAGAVLDNTDENSKVVILTRTGKRYLIRIFSQMPSDKVTDLIENLPGREISNFLHLMAINDTREVIELLSYGEEDAGRMMTKDFFRVRESLTVMESVRILRNHRDVDLESYIYVTDNDDRLRGIITFRQLAFAEAGDNISDIMKTEDLITVPDDMDREEAARIIRKYDLLAVPVLRGEHLAGIITVDDAMEVLQEENSEDVYRMGGTAERDPLRKNILRKIALRLPFVFVTLITGVFCTLSMKFYGSSLKEVVEIAFFIPIIVGIAGNVGIQSATIVVRGLATKEVALQKISSMVFREVSAGAVIGLVCGFLAGILAFIIHGTFEFGAVISVSMFIATVIASLFGNIVPLI
ncbi:MAG: magnesium transporter, partial [Fibrobacterota bacterium]